MNMYKNIKGIWLNIFYSLILFKCFDFYSERVANQRVQENNVPVALGQNQKFSSFDPKLDSVRRSSLPD